MFNAFLIPHIVAGLISVILFWIPAFSKKGSALHVNSGRVYMWLMWIVVITAFIMCWIRLFQGVYVMAIFLGYLSIITAKPLWLSIAAFQERSNKFWRIKLSLECIIFTSGCALIALGILWRDVSASPLMILFGSLGLTALSDIRNSLKYREKHSPIQIHIAETITSAIAGYTAFFAFGAREYIADVLTGHWMILPWILPTVLGVIAIKIIVAKYEIKKSKVLSADTVHEGAQI